jgi:hypothetical protein
MCQAIGSVKLSFRLVSVLNFTFFAQAAAPVIEYPPHSQNVLLYERAAFGVIASGTTPFSYQWLKNAVPIPGATNDQIILASAQFADAAAYLRPRS